MKTLIAGFGSIGRRHLNNLRTLGETDFILLRSHLSTLPDDAIKDIPVVTHIDAALSQHPDAVVIANPTALHLDVAIPAAKAGCSILMEKPVSHSMDRIAEFKSALKSGGGRVLVGYQFRFHPGLQQVKAWLDSGKIGSVVSCRVNWGEYLPDWHPWEDYRKSYSARTDLGGGVVNTLSHPLDYLRWLFGEVQNLWAYTSRNGLELDVEDTAEIGLQFENGVLCSTHLDYVQRPPEHTMKITGSKGSIEWNNATGLARLYDPETKQWQESTLPAGFERNFLFVNEMRHFLDVTKGKASPLCTLDDGLEALKLAQAIYRSVKEGQQIVINKGLETEHDHI